MTLKVAVIADDLTGALDTGVTFVARGLSVVAAVTPDALEEALAENCDVVAVSTASRDLDPREAGDLVSAVAARLVAAKPGVLLKKVDSRLKGNVARETAALAEAFGLRRAIVAPAVPDQGRFTVNGEVVGTGVAQGIPVRASLGAQSFAIDVRDAASDADLDAVAAEILSAPGEVLAVGARGLGAALARALGTSSGAGRPFPAAPSTLFAFGSRDPITAAQIERLVEASPDVMRVPAPEGAIPLGPDFRLPCVVHSTGENSAPHDVARRFSGGVAALVARLRPEALVMGGGDTTLAILARLGVRIVRPLGEAAPGLPWFELRGSGPVAGLRCVAKSGGFGDPAILAALLSREPA